MTIRPILIAPDKRLKLRSNPVGEVDGEIRTLLGDMLETMYADDGLGLAAIQVGVPKRVVVIDVHGPDDPPAPIKLVNPEILWFSPERMVYEEGCLSFPEYFADVERAAEVRVRYLDENGDAQEIEAKETLAVCLQHEVDHLDGKLFVDHLSLVKRGIIMRKLAKARRAEAKSA
ncbi:MAG: peptide deformylase [Rhodospirillaceae bacterium]|nr:peptide deformylase [Rhodospirillaceae bacterium]MBT3928684.1 peptide deformylase [Rhodospirillaceae bacterium]MBT4427620.1 peptide deformylase [Rhodospirillaceae bacterium]MBT5040543.1 peptide deformylase [Rhodospirillaceae bacterium]MBT6830984.1 peptide deformylase [Rhodospirillaceae bacterium]